MDFGRLPDISAVDFTLPPDHRSVSKVLGGVKDNSVQIYVGAPVWADPGFIGKIYPENAAPKNFVKYYAEQFNCIELNATHYKIPDVNTIENWVDKVSPHFKFCPKVPQVISHAIHIEHMSGDMNEFTRTISFFGKQLGTVFLQLPPYFGTDKLPRLLTFLDKVNTTGIAVELRHESWFINDSGHLNELSNYLYKNSMGLVITDVAGRRDVLHQRLTNKTAFIRFVANNLHASDFKRMDDWAQRAVKWMENGLVQLYFFIHTPDKSLCPELAIYFIEKINGLTGMKL